MRRTGKGRRPMALTNQRWKCWYRINMGNICANVSIGFDSHVRFHFHHVTPLPAHSPVRGGPRPSTPQSQAVPPHRLRTGPAHGTGHREVAGEGPEPGEPGPPPCLLVPALSRPAAAWLIQVSVPLHSNQREGLCPQLREAHGGRHRAARERFLRHAKSHRAAPHAQNGTACDKHRGPEGSGPAGRAQHTSGVQRPRPGLRHRARTAATPGPAAPASSSAWRSAAPPW